MNKSNLYYCYSIPLFKYLENEKDIKSIGNKSGFHPTTRKEYKVFYRNDELDIALTEWKQVKIQAIEYIKSQNTLLKI
jgi:hypothetical protein